MAINDYRINLTEYGDTVDVVISNKLLVHIVRSDCGFIVDAFNSNSAEECLGSLCIYDDELEKEEE